MAFTLKFYNVSDPPNKLEKTIPENASHVAQSVYPYEAVSELTGQFLIDYTAAVNSCNYCYCEDLGKYYYITDIQMETGSRMIITVKVDALMTYKDDIKDMDILATRSSVHGLQNGNVGYNSMLDDGTWRCDATALYHLSSDLMGGAFNYDLIENNASVNRYILMTAG